MEGAGGDPRHLGDGFFHPFPAFLDKEPERAILAGQGEFDVALAVVGTQQAGLFAMLRRKLQPGGGGIVLADLALENDVACLERIDIGIAGDDPQVARPFGQAETGGIGIADEFPLDAQDRGGEFVAWFRPAG